MSFIDFFYGTAVGREVFKELMRAGMPKAMAAFMHSPLSRPMIKSYIKKNDIDMSGYEPAAYRCFAEFFIRKRIAPEVDLTPSHLISPCDCMLSYFPIAEDSAFGIKDSLYRVEDLTGDAELSEGFRGGDCLIFRLRANDYHRYCFIDSCFAGENRFFEGELHSVQPTALLRFPVYRINRRMCTVLDTDNFGKVIQTEVGAMAVGGIVNLRENERADKGEEMGRFELCGSTIVMFFEKGRISLLPALRDRLLDGREVYVRYGEQIGEQCRER